MKRLTIILSVLFIFLNSHLNAQLILEENFDYEPGLLSVQSDSNWIDHKNPDIRVVEDNLSYPQYPSSGKGNCIYYEGISYKGHSIRSIENAIKKDIYISFLLMAKNTLNLANYGMSFLCFANSSSAMRANVCIKKSAISGNINIGIYKNTEHVVFCEKDLPVMTPILVVMKYTFKPDSSDDLVSLWIDPPLTQLEPVANVETGAGQLDFTDFKSVFIKPNSNTGNLYLDGIRVSTNWADAPLPVELSSFTGSVRGDKVILDWKTETEIDNYGFDIQRRTSVQGDWNKIGFVYGHGNSNSPKIYSFTDNNIYGSSTCLYRLKQIDKDGSYSFSDEVKIDIAPADFILFQNYPNPFNPSTLIRFSLPEEGFTSVNIYNPVGERISVLLNEYVTRGYHEIYFNASGINSGIYLCVVETCGSRKAIKMVLAR